jgi:predicted ATPase
VQLFVERVTALVEDFALNDANTPRVVEICRRLDGLPLAIEFAAPRVAVLGVEGLAARLDDILPLLVARRPRAALPRHQTMRAVLDWSYGLLSEDEQLFFRALGIFSGRFTVEAAAAVVIASATETSMGAIDRLAELVAKSLVAADVSGAKPRFRLLDMVRAYTGEKLDASGEREQIARTHAMYYCNLFKRAEAEVPERPSDEWLADYAQEIDNLRGALDWAFSTGGDKSIAATLTQAAIPLWIRLSLLEECHSRAKEALGVLGTAGTLDHRARGCGCSPHWADQRLRLPRWVRHSPRYWSSRRVSAIPNTSCAHFGACITTTPRPVGTVPHCRLRKSYMIWQ